MKVAIDERIGAGGRHLWFIIAAEDGKNAHGKEVEEGEDMTGFFTSEDKAEEHAKKAGWVIVE